MPPWLIWTGIGCLVVPAAALLAFRWYMRRWIKQTEALDATWKMDFEAAEMEAKRTLDRFKVKLGSEDIANPQVKAEVQVSENLSLEIWLANVSFDCENWIGYVAENSAMPREVVKGQKYEFHESVITDWTYRIGSERFGGYSIAVARRMRAEDSRVERLYGSVKPKK